MENLINITIDGKNYSVPAGKTVLKTCEALGIDLPRLCFLEGINESSACRLCLVEVEGQRNLKTSCSFATFDGMVIKTNSERVFKSVTNNLKLIAANHVFECWKCPREHNCELLTLMRRFNISNDLGEDSRYSHKERYIDNEGPAIVIDSGKCILCGRCIGACDKLSGMHILDFNNRGSETVVGPALLHNIDDSGCIYCGKCIQACPVGALRERDDIDKVLSEIRNPKKFTVVQAAPAVRSALSEEFGYPVGTDSETKMYSAMKALGFDEIADVNWGADLTIMEEGTEFIGRLKNNDHLPMFTSCCPGWIRYIEQYQEEYLPNLSSCKSPNQMSGSMVKHYWAKKLGVDPSSVTVVAVMPCIAKKSECKRPEMETDGLRDVDYVLTTREFARMIKRQGIDYKNLKEFKPEGELSKYTGAGTIFGVTGGVMEAALRTVVEVLEGKTLEKVEFNAVRGMSDIKEASLEVAGTTVNVAVVHGGTAIKKFFEILKEGKKQYHFVEIMACAGGCINGGGQPIVSAKVSESNDIIKLRASVLYNEDSGMKLRKSHENESVMLSYKDFLGEPNSHKAHSLLHTTYKNHEFFNLGEDEK